ncbi:hypothetical protein F4778DRAFT_783708 [Xylariomycetidae sp. FL2044]|nr:hypothetical protein F4778DRAFT_783708 [Xylariomycetidae sp. FL2044]
MFLQLLHLAQVALAAYGSQQSYIAIGNLRKYEEASEKLAKFSSEAERQLHKTRTTQASGAVSMLLTLFVALLLAIRGSSYSFLVRYLASPAMFAITVLARRHIEQYWAGKDGRTVGKKVPLPKMADYNEAEEKTEEILKVLDWLMLSWVATSAVALLSGY